MRKNFTDNSVLLMKAYDLNKDNFYKVKLLDICKEKDCFTTDLRAFIQAYFKEVTNYKIFEKYKEYGSSSGPFILRKDSEGILKEENGEDKMKSLGLMLSLALATETFLGFEFSRAFLTPNQKTYLLDLLDLELYWIDEEQKRIFSQIKYQLRGDSFIYDPHSSKPFKLASDTSSNSENLLFAARDYPLELASENIFIVPYKKSNELIDEGVKHFFGKPIENHHNRSMGMVTSSKIGVQLYTMFFDGNESLDMTSWRDNSIYNSSTRMFWKALKDFSNEDKLKIYRKATGLYKIPSLDFNRLPKTRLVPHDGMSIQFVPERYEVKVPAYSSHESMKCHLRKALNENYVNLDFLLLK